MFQVKKPGGPEGGLAHEIFYVPQRPYVTLGTLQDQLIYPVQRSGAACLHLLLHVVPPYPFCLAAAVVLLQLLATPCV